MDELKRESEENKSNLSNQIADMQKAMQSQKEEAEQNRKRDQNEFERKLKDKERDLDSLRQEQERQRSDMIKGTVFPFLSFILRVLLVKFFIFLFKNDFRDFSKSARLDQTWHVSSYSYGGFGGTKFTPVTSLRSWEISLKNRILAIFTIFGLLVNCLENGPLFCPTPNLCQARFPSSPDPHARL